MKNIFTYQDFLLEMYNPIKFKLLLSDEITDIISKIDLPISDIILNFKGELDVSYIDTTSVPEMISYYRLDNYKKSLLKLDDVKIVNRDLWNSKYREQMRLGKFINQILAETKSSIGPVEIENFVNQYKGIFSSIRFGFQNFDMVYGENLRKFYYEKTYMTGGGFLNNGCMRHDYCQKYLNIYVENPDKINLLIMRNPKNKLKIDGKALIWNLDSHKGKKLMDLPYCTKNYMMTIFQEYAMKKGWYYTKIEEGKDNYRFLNIFDSKGNKTDEAFEVNVTPEEYEYYPHVDLLKYYNPYTGNLTNDKSVIKDDEDYIILDQDNGSYTTVKDTLNESFENKEFKDWFGESKIVKGEKPLLVYHFNKKDKIDPFNKNEIYFTDDKKFGKRYLGFCKEHKAYLKIINPFICTNKNLKLIFEEYHPYNKEYWSREFNDENSNKNSNKECYRSYGYGKSGYDGKILNYIYNYNQSNLKERKIVHSIITKLKYDGVIIPYDWDGKYGTIKSFVVFDKNQIWEL